MPPSNARSLAQLLFAPRSVAIVGQSNDAGKTAGRPLKYLRQAGYAGRIYPVNPRRDEVLGERAWPSLAALPEVPEHAYVVTGTEARSRRSRSAAGSACRWQRCWPTASARPARKARSARRGSAKSAPRPAFASSVRRASASSTCGTGSFLTANAAFDERGLPAGRIFAASHSGGMIGTLLSRGKARGIHFAGLVSVGNEVDLSIGEICAGDARRSRHRRLRAVPRNHAQGASVARFRARSRGARQAGAGLQARPLGRGARAFGVAHRRARRRGRHRRHVPRRMRHRPGRYARRPDRRLSAAGARAAARRAQGQRCGGHHHRRRRHHGGRSAQRRAASRSRRRRRRLWRVSRRQPASKWRRHGSSI